MRLRPSIALAWAIFVACFVPCTALAQATGAVSGLVTDQMALPIPGASVEVVSLGTNQPRATTTDAEGRYTVPLLAPGPYRVSVSLFGFNTVTLEAVVTVESTARADAELVVSPVAIVDHVHYLPEPLIETTKSSLGLVIRRQQIEELPLNGRNFTQLGTLLPGVVGAPATLGGAAGEATPGGFGAATAGFSVNGQRNQSNNFLLDGASNNDTFNTGFVLRPPPDAIEEFKILTHAYAAEYGRNAGSIVNVVTRSGSNHLHGAAWEFNRDAALQARNVFAPIDQPKPSLSQHQFGGSLGGPVSRDRLFGFGYYEGHRNTSGLTQNFVVLSDAQRLGDFAGGAPIRDPLTGQPFEGNRIPSGRIDPAARQLVEQFLPHANTGAARYIVSPDVVDNRHQFGMRLDYQWSPEHALLGRYLGSRTYRNEPPTTRPIGTVSRATLHDFMVADTQIIGSSLFNVARVSYNRIGATPATTSGLSNTAYGVNVPHNVEAAQGLANIAVTGFFNFGDAQQPFVDRVNEVVQWTNELSWFRRGHLMKLGLDVRRERMLIAFVNRPNGDFTFDGTATGNAAADFLLGLPAQFRRATTNTAQDGVGWLSAGFVQDEFRWSNVTVSAGLRYELPLPFADRRDALNSFRPGQQSRRFPGAPVGLVYPGDPGVPRGTYPTDRNNLAPRLGVNWDPSRAGRTSLRASWGLFYDALAGQGDFFQNGVLAPPFTPVLEVNAPPASLTLRDPLAGVSGAAADFPPGLIFIGWGEDFRTPASHHFNVTWQQELGSRFGAEIGYVGSRGFNLPIFIEVNPGLYATGQTSRGARLFPAYGLVRPTFSVARSWYDSLQTSLRMRPRAGVHFLISYTLGHAVDHVSGLNIGGEQRPVLPVTIGDEASIDRALALEKGDALFDVRHRFVASFGAALPSLRNATAAIRQLLGGWQVNGIVQAQTGFPATVYDPTLSIRYLTNRPNQICDPNENAPHTAAQWFNTACFARRPLAATAEPGSTPRGSVRGPGFARTDLSLFKNVDLRGQHRLQFRIEAFNVWNQTQFRQPDIRIGAPTFGSITAAEDGRIVQLAVKYSF